MPSFTEHFWGEKNNGFDVLYHNMKHGYMSSKEFADFLRESCSVEETYAKLLNKLAKQASSSGVQGSFSPFWQLLKALTEKVSNLHLQLVHSWQDLIKDVTRYSDEQHKKHKAIKDSESATLETVQSIQQIIVALGKAKENYNARCLELEKLRRENAAQKDIEKAETKFKKANDEYRSLVDKYANVRNDFEKKMTDSCQKFQEVEEHHLRQMKDFVDTYSKAWEHQHALLGRVHEELKVNSSELSVEKLIDTFIHTKMTGDIKPGPIEFEEADTSSLASSNSLDQSEKKEFPILEKPSKTGVPGFLSKSKREKKKEKKKKKKDKEDEGKEEEQTPKVDEEGFSIRPDNPQENDDKSWYSSDSDSDSDVEERRKIKVEIKPLNSNGTTPTNNMDDLCKSIEGLRRLPSPTTMRKNTSSSDTSMKKSTSITDTLKSNTSSSSINNNTQDLLGLDFLGGATNSNASTPTPTGLYNFPSPSQREATSTPVAQGSVDFYIDSPADTPPSVPARRAQGASTPTGVPLLAGPPPSRTSRSTLPSKATARPAGRQSPAPISINRADSLGNLNNTTTFNTTSMPFSSSRGPSPLTIGMSDSIPLAVAFSESVNALFRGSDDHSCKVKITGDMMVSFPAGIVRVLTENPNPATFSFRVKNTNAMEHILVNKQLLSQDMSQSTPDSTVYQFEMGALTDHLRRQAETNRMASYFNIDIVKYQVRTSPGIGSTPLHLVCYWKCDANQTDFRLDYKYNGSSIANRHPLTNVSVLVPVDGEVTNMQSMPNGTWSGDNRRAIWKLHDISEMNEDGGNGCIRAKFDLDGGPSSPSPVAVQFVCEGTTLSGADFELAGSGYRVSLVKKRFVTGKYLAEPDQGIKIS